ncbi:hypothetical protein D1AOALGA4SA_1294 [Olavius algarvensis Delta 1 endosymbiont]|nr:hypothetical protein D1AOALGA4SA_1294 [Olavius algarvensis Delta 1 endosymbiont]
MSSAFEGTHHSSLKILNKYSRGILVNCIARLVEMKIFHHKFPIGVKKTKIRRENRIVNPY